MVIYNILNTILVTFVEAIVVLFIFSNLNNKPEFVINNKTKSLIFCVLYTIISYWGLTANLYILQILLLGLFTVISLSFILNVKLLYSLLSSMLIFAYFTVIKLLISLVVILATGLEFSDLSGQNFYILGIGLLGNFLGAAIFYLLLRKITMFSFNTVKRENSFWSLILLHIFVVAVFIIRLNTIDNKIPEVYLYEGMFVIAYLLCVILSFWDFEDRRKKQYINTRYKVQQSYINSLEKTIDIVRRLKHDFLNQLNTINALCTIDEPDSKERIQSCIERAANKTSSSFTYFDTGNDFLNVLLAIKNNLALENNIKMEVEIKSSLAVAEIKEEELACAVDNIIENAFEAFSPESDNEEKKIVFEARIEKDKMLILIKNNGPKIPYEIIKKIFEHGFSSKSIRDDEIGYGLYMSKKIIEDNGGNINVCSDDNETVFTIVLNV